MRWCFSCKQSRGSDGWHYVRTGTGCCPSRPLSIRSASFHVKWVSILPLIFYLRLGFPRIDRFVHLLAFSRNMPRSLHGDGVTNSYIFFHSTPGTGGWCGKCLLAVSKFFAHQLPRGLLPTLGPYCYGRFGSALPILHP